MEELIQKREEELHTTEITLKEKFNQEKIQYERKIKDLEAKVNELQDYEEKQAQYNEKLTQLE